MTEKKNIRVPVEVDIAIDPEDNTLSICLYDIPIDKLEGILLNMGEEVLRQNLLDGVRGAQVAQDLGIDYTERTFQVFSKTKGGEN